MARARNIKPGFFFNEYLGQCDPLTALAFIGLWMVADRCGRFEYRPMKLAATIFPYRENGAREIARIIRNLSSNGFLYVYRAQNDQILIQIINWAKHQNPHKNEKPSTLEPPPENHSITDSYEILETLSSNYASTSDLISCTRADSLIPDSLIPDSQKVNPNPSATLRGLDKKKPKQKKSADTQKTHSDEKQSDQKFNEFWKTYPLKKSKAAAQKSFAKLNPSAELLDTILAAIRNQITEHKKFSDAGEFHPEWKYPATWLNGKCWEDEICEPQKKSDNLLQFGNLL